MKRGFACIAAVAFSLAACDGPPDENRSAPSPAPKAASTGNFSAGPDGVRPASRDAGPAPAALPERFLGTWDASLAACAGPPGEMRLVVEPDRLLFHDSVARIEAVRPVGEDRVEADLAVQGEGERWRETRTLRLLPEGRLAVDAAGPPAERVRCE